MRIAASEFAGCMEGLLGKQTWWIEMSKNQCDRRHERSCDAPAAD
jgi:hypothetical protein